MRRENSYYWHDGALHRVKTGHSAMVAVWAGAGWTATAVPFAVLKPKRVKFSQAKRLRPAAFDKVRRQKAE